MSEDSKKKRSIPLWAWIVTLVVVAALGVGGTLFFTRDKDSGDEPSADGTAETPGDLKVAEACFGGEDAHEAVVAAHDELPITDKGAATFAAAFSRWITEFPVDPAMDDKVEPLFERGWENGWAHELPNRQEIDPEILTRRTDTSTSTYRVYRDETLGVWAVVLKRDVVTNYSDETSETVTITDGFLLDPRKEGKWQYSTSFNEEQISEIPKRYNGGEETPEIPFSNPCRADQ
ncbi:hypothetical protein [Brevibacterium sp. FME17]|uniref:hypothetical protein n=1 Tax=Brevibacterium sp. FME17 TaxID=2742606 RepID=UPI001868EB55|nr:hypothetical protein [Brevibacterium sp. FME17]